MPSTKKPCRTCGKEFLIIEQEQKFINERGLPLPDECPTCRQARREKLRGGRKLYRAKCQDCKKDIIVSYEPSTIKSKILCFDCYKKYTESHDFIIKENGETKEPKTSQDVFVNQEKKEK